MNKCNQTRISRGFSLIVDDSGHRKRGIAKNRNILIKSSSKKAEAIRIDEYAQWISSEEFREIQIQGEKPRTVWVAIIEAEISK
jgi:hypothetical protein